MPCVRSADPPRFEVRGINPIFVITSETEPVIGLSVVWSPEGWEADSGRRSAALRFLPQFENRCPDGLHPSAVSGPAQAEPWDAVVPSIAVRARVLRYDHRNAPLRGTAARTVSALLGDLERLLTALALKPPYVIVGHSWGGVIARLFTHAHPLDVAGLVFADATHEAIDARTLAVLPAMYW